MANKKSKRAKNTTKAGALPLSSILIEYGKPLLDECASVDQVRDTVQFLIVCWNLALHPEDERIRMTETLLHDITKKRNLAPNEYLAMKRDIQRLITRKQARYSHFPNFITGFTVQGEMDKWKLDITFAKL